jgi:hypothetical protein
MKRSEYLEWKYKYSMMDPDYIVDVLNISSQELLDHFPQKFEALLNEEFNAEDEQDEGDRDYGREPFHDGEDSPVD